MPANKTIHLRLARVLENGNILYVAGNQLVEADQAGEIVRFFSLAGAGYSWWRKSPRLSELQRGRNSWRVSLRLLQK